MELSRSGRGSFDNNHHHIAVGGHRRRDNGVDLRALLYAVFKVGLLAFCIEKGNLNPGFALPDLPIAAYCFAEQNLS